MGPMVDQGVVEKSYPFSNSSVAENLRLNVKFTIRSPNAPAITSKSVVNLGQSMSGDQMQKTL